MTYATDIIKTDLDQVFYNFAWTVVMVAQHKKRRVIWPQHHESVIADTAQNAIALARFNVRNKLDVLHIVRATPESIGVAFYKFGEYESLSRDEKEQIPFPEAYENPETFKR